VWRTLQTKTFEPQDAKAQMISKTKMACVFSMDQIMDLFVFLASFAP
jgi:hypothetical protein